MVCKNVILNKEKSLLYEPPLPKGRGTACGGGILRGEWVKKTEGYSTEHKHNTKLTDNAKTLRKKYDQRRTPFMVWFFKVLFRQISSTEI